MTTTGTNNPTTTTVATDLFRQGRLDDAVAAATAAVKARPTDAAARWLLAELLCFAGNLDRADLQLDALAQQHPAAAVGVTLFRQLVRAEQARQQFYTDGRLPEFLEPPSPDLRLRLEAAVALRAGDRPAAARLLRDAELQRPRLAGTCNGTPFDDLRDLDDLCAVHLEVLTGDGRYFWVPLAAVESLAFLPPERPRDLLWRKARLATRTGPAGDVHVPALYPGSHADPDPAIRLGRSTAWDGPADDTDLARGRGLRTLLAGDADLTLLDLKSLTFSHLAAPLAGRVPPPEEGTP